MEIYRVTKAITVVVEIDVEASSEVEAQQKANMLSLVCDPQSVEAKNYIQDNDLIFEDYEMAYEVVDQDDVRSTLISIVELDQWDIEGD